MEQLTDSIYVAPGNLRGVRPWIGIVATAAGSVLIDSGNGPAHAQEIQAAMEAMNLPPVSHILLTHHHWDHVFGSCVFPNAKVVAHELTNQHLLVMAREPWSEQYVREKAGDDPLQQLIAGMMLKAVPDWTEFHALPAHVTFANDYRLELGGKRFLMEHVGGQHEPDQSVIHVLPDNVLFLGDATYGRGRRDNWDFFALADELESFLSWRALYYVEGHRRPATPDVFRARITQLRNLGNKG